jgi:phytoene dehydrogenase-like protein
MSVIVQSTPYKLRDRSWDEHRDAFGDLVVRTLDDYAPGLAALVVARQVLTPVDLEREFGLTGGHPMHAEQGLDQFYLWRPLLGHAVRLAWPLPGRRFAPGCVRARTGRTRLRVLADWR